MSTIDDLKWRSISDCFPVLYRQVLMKDPKGVYCAGTVIISKESANLLLKVYQAKTFIPILETFVEWTYLD